MNKQFLEGAITIEEAERVLQKFIEITYLTTKKTIELSTHNQALLKKFWDDNFEWRTYIDVASKRSCFNYYRRAVEALGSESLLLVTELDIKKLYSKFPKSKQVDLYENLKRILKWLKRDVRLPVPREDKQVITHLSLKELPKLLKVLPHKAQRLLVLAGFFSGCRKGELLKLTEESCAGAGLRVETQLSEVNAVRKPKSRSGRIAFVHRKGRKWVEAWAKLPIELKLRAIRSRAKGWGSLVEYSKQAFPNEPNKWCSIHDLRHCYSIHLLALGHSDDRVAKSIGDDIDVFREYYSGYILTESLIEAMDKL